MDPDNTEQPLKDLEHDANNSAGDSSKEKKSSRKTSKSSRKWLKKGGGRKLNPLEIENLPELEENALSRYSQCLRKLRNTSRHYVEIGKAIAEIRSDGLWRVKDYHSFHEWYLEHGYSADEVCNLIAGSRLLEALIEDHDPWVKVSHAMVLLRARGPGVSRLEADIGPLREIYRSVVKAAEGRVTIKAIKEALEAEGLIKATTKKDDEKDDDDANGAQDMQAGTGDTVDLGPDSEEEAQEKTSEPPQKYEPPEELQRARLLAMQLATESKNDPIHPRLEELLKLINSALGL